MDNFEKTKREVLQPILIELGAGLIDGQIFEYTLKYFLYLLSKLGIEKIDYTLTIDLLEGKDKKTLGKLIEILKTSISMSDNIILNLTNALNARNYLIHNYYNENAERFAISNEYKNIKKEIISLRQKIQYGSQDLEPFIKILALKVDNIDIELAQNNLKKNFLNQFPKEI